MFTSKHSIGTLYVSGVPNPGSINLAQNLTKRGFEAFTIVAGLGVWRGEHETSFVVTIMGETAAPAHNEIVPVGHRQAGAIGSHTI